VEFAIIIIRDNKRQSVRARAELAAEERVLDALVGDNARPDTRDKFRQMLRDGKLDDKEIVLQMADHGAGGMPSFDIPGMPGAQMGMINLGDMLGGAMGKPTKEKRTTVAEAYDPLINEESDNLLDDEDITQDAIQSVEQHGIVFLDEIDKICARSDRTGGDVSREGVQRDLLPLIEGTTVSTKHGLVKTDHILFIASGAFSVAKPSDLLPELQGRLPIRVELRALTEEDFKRILTEPEASLIKQYKALMATEDVTLDFTDCGIERLAQIATEVNTSVENIGARRLHTIMEQVLDDISFEATDRPGTTLTLDADYVNEHIGNLVKDDDLSRHIL